MDFVSGVVTAKGSKSNVLEMFQALEDYYDKDLISESGTEDDYCITFNFSSRMTSFFDDGDYFLGYSEDYEREIPAEMKMEVGGVISLKYNNSEIITGVAEYGLDDI